MPGPVPAHTAWMSSTRDSKALIGSLKEERAREEAVLAIKIFLILDEVFAVRAKRTWIWVAMVEANHGCVSIYLPQNLRNSEDENKWASCVSH